MLALIITLSVLLAGVSLYAIMLLVRVNQHTSRINELAEKNRELNALAHSGDLENLRYKLNPHLFKNALNSIQSHAYQTWYSMDKLSGVLDYVLYDSDKSFVGLAEEMEFAANFIEINRLKVSPLFDLTVRNTIDAASEDSAGLLIMPLITVDLIENAFKHTDFQKSESFISISFQLENGIFQLEVRNRISDTETMKQRNSGIGIKTLQERLKITYPEKHALIIENQGNVFHTHLQLDLNA